MTSVAIIDSLPEDFSPEERGERAKNYFLEGYNCCQAVLLAFSDILEANALASEELLKMMGSGFGGGMGRMREVCGSFSGAVFMAGFISPASDPKNIPGRTANYALVQEFADEFKKLNGGSIVCRELLGLSRPTSNETPQPGDRTPEYYKKRPCPEIVRNSARMVAEKLSKLA